jgi:predicted Zn-dependent peptidase
MEIIRHKLPNGATTLLVRDIGCPSITVMCLIKVGSRNESALQGGISHVIEHNIFKGTKKRPSAKKITYEVENLGASMNAYTSKEYTEYYLKAPKEKLPQMVEILADLMKNPIFPENELKKEKQVIIEEIKMYKDVPQDLVGDIFLEKLYKKHPLGANIAGTVKSVTGISSDDCLKFHRESYVANNMLIVVSGDFETVSAQEVLREHFGDVKKGKLKTVKLFKPYKINNKIFQKAKNLNQTHIVLGGFAHGYHLSARDKIAYGLGSTILSGGFGSKLFQKIREDLGLAYYVHLGYQQYRESGHFEVRLGVDHKNIQAAIAAVLLELDNFVHAKVTDEELTRAKNLLEGNFITYFETSETLANWYGSQILLQ